MEETKPKVVKMKVLITIVDYEKEKQLTQMYINNHIPLNIVTHGLGTASSEMLDYFGLGETRKNLTISIIAENQIKNTFQLLYDKMNFEQPGKGVAFTIPISCISHILTCLDEYQMGNNVKRKGFEEDIMKQEKLFELIIIIVSQGFTDQTMEAAKAAGASGGTVIHARGLGSSEAAKFLEISVQPEKELILILTKRDDKAKIMESVNKAVGLNTKGKGIMFSLPVDDTVGLGIPLN